MRSITDAAEVRGKVMREIIEENGRKRPANLEILIEEKAGEELDKIAQKFINNVGNDEQIVSSSNGGNYAKG